MKVVLAALNPLGIPLAVQVVARDRAGDPWPKVPAIEQVRSGLELRGLLYVGDTKMISLSTRAWLQAGQDDYLEPLSATQMPVEALEKALEKVWSGEHKP